MIVKRSLTIRGHRTSISLENDFWSELKVISGERGQSLAALVAAVDAARDPSGNLSSALRVFVLRQALLARDQNSSGGATPGKPS